MRWIVRHRRCVQHPFVGRLKPSCNILAKDNLRKMSTKSGSPKTLLPGFGRPANYIPRKEDSDYVGDLFQNSLSGWDFTLPMTPLREFTMLQIMNIITDKPDWSIKINDPEITTKWKEEALASGRDITPNMLEYCLKELRHKATLLPEAPANPPPIIVYNGDVVKSDFAVSADFKQRLQQAVTAFEGAIPASKRDWHPGSGDKVWDLVHPSLFPLVYGRTRILENGETTTLDNWIEYCGRGKQAGLPSFHQSIGRYGYSDRFQWLPCEVDISGDKARITSYINNLHPREKSLYSLLEELIDASIPMWNLTLAPLRPGLPHFSPELRIKYTHAKYDYDRMDHDSDGNKEQVIEEGREQMDTKEAVKRGEEEEFLVALEDDDAEDDEEAKAKVSEDEEADKDDNKTKKFDPFEILEWEGTPVLPEPPEEYVPLRSPPTLDLREEYGKRGLQVIVKLANIELTPEKPEYEGGTWHIEGQVNEHIVATSLYYYSCSNITPSSLSFRQMFATDDDANVRYPQDHHKWLPAVFGVEQDGPTIQEVGGVETREGRLLTFPNILQHRVGPFKLADPTKPGHRKIVALFLVDPNIKIISTAHVPCQRQDWWWDAVQAKKAPNASEHPFELEDRILGSLHGAEFPISLRDAQVFREELMEERKAFVVNHSGGMEDHTISLCEH